MFAEADQYVQDRSRAMEQVETTIVELGDMFVQLAGMVKGELYILNRFVLSGTSHYKNKIYPEF